MEKESVPQKSDESVKKWLMPFLMPTLVGKSLILYFGLLYSENPGEGYGVGLALSAAFTLSMLGRFLWKTRNYVDRPEDEEGR